MCAIGMVKLTSYCEGGAGTGMSFTGDDGTGGGGATASGSGGATAAGASGTGGTIADLRNRLLLLLGNLLTKPSFARSSGAPDLATLLAEGRRFCH